MSLRAFTPYMVIAVPLINLIFAKKLVQTTVCVVLHCVFATSAQKAINTAGNRESEDKGSCKNKRLIPTFTEAILITFSDAKDNTFPVFTRFRHRSLFLVVPQHTPTKNKISR